MINLQLGNAISVTDRVLSVNAEMEYDSNVRVPIEYEYESVQNFARHFSWYLCRCFIALNPIKVGLKKY